MPIPSQGRWLFICLDSWCFLCYWQCQWASRCFTASCLLRDGTYFITDALCRVGFSPVPVLRLVCHLTVFWVTPTAICPSPCKAAAPSASVNSSAPHWYSLAKGGLLKERCWANGMIVLVIWKLPALCVCRYWQWCSRRIYGSSKTLVNFSLLVRCHLCTNEVIECALYAAAGTVLTSRSCTGTSLCDAATEQSTGVGQTLGNFKCFFLITSLFPLIFQILNCYLRK